jgi:predicted nucleotidyltransferase
VLAAARSWAAALSAQRPEVRRVGVIGSCARGAWGVGSDLDLVIELHTCDEPAMYRLRGVDTRAIPVPVDLLVLTTGELEALGAAGGRFARELARDVIWL